MKATFAFLFAFIAGLLLILGGTALRNTWLSVGGGVLSVLVYASMAPFAERWKVSREQFGDSSYFLGFLFTLSALIITLWSLEPTLEPEAVAERVIPQFALALLTTVVGLVARMVISGFVPNQEEAIDAAEAALAEASNRLRTQMDLFGTQMAQHASGTQRFMGTVLEEARRAIQAHVEALAPLPGRVEAAMDAVARRLERSLGSALEPLGGAVGSAADALEKDAARLGGSVQAAARAIDEASERISSQPSETFTTAVHALESSVGGAAAVLESSTRELSEATARARSSAADLARIQQEQVAAAEALGRALRATAEVHTGVTAAWKDAREHLQALGETSRNTVGSLSELTQGLSAVSGSLEKELAGGEELRALRQRLVKDFGQLDGALVEVLGELEEAMALLRQRAR